MKKMNNKGFSLVELIIVIAIMAILIVVLAPQYLKYVERSRNSTDLQSATEFKDAIEVWAADPEAGTGGTTAFKNSDTFTITATATGATVTGSGSDAVEDALASGGLSLSNFKCTSKTRWDDMKLTGTVQSSGAIQWTYASTNGDFAAAMGQP